MYLRRQSALISLLAIISTQTFFQLAIPAAYADTSPQTLPFSQDWTDTGLITTDNNWSGVVGIIGYRGDGMTGATGVDPQTITADGSTTPVSVLANQTNTGITNGAVAEFHIANPVVAFQGSGTARAPHIVLTLNTTGQTGISIAYNLRDIDSGTDNSVQPVALQYRVGATGAYTNIPAGFVADASDGPSLTKTTPVNVALPASADNQAVVQLRILTTDAVGSDEWIGVDDIVVSGGSGSTPLSGVGSATPNPVAAGTSTLLTVTVTPGTNPSSTGIGVVGDLTLIGGASNQQFFDNGTNGDVTSGDNIFSFLATVPAPTGAGLKNLPTVITDAQSRTANANIALTVNSTSTSPSVVGAANPNSVLAGGTTLLTATVTPGTNPASTGLIVTGNLSTIGGSASQAFFDNGTNGDVTSGDNIFSYSATVGGATSSGAKTLPITVTDAQTRSGNGSISLTVTLPPATGQPLPFSQNWNNTGLITTNNVWSGVPGIVGYLGDYTSSSPTGVDPQTLVADFSDGTVSVVANQTTPDTNTSGGVAEYELADPVVALQGSGTADAPHLVISVNTTGATNIAVTYNLRDIDGSTDNAVQPVALQYRIGSTGTFTNIPGAFVADASSGPSLATLVTSVGVLLPAAAENQALVQLRIITTNAVGSDEWIGVDDINVVNNGTLPLSASGSASPSNVEAGNSTLLTVTVNPGTNPTSTGIDVVGDLASINGSATQPFLDDGLNGDSVAGDNIFSYLAQVPLATSSGSKSLPIIVTDAQTRSANVTIGLLVSAGTDPQLHLTMGIPSAATTDVNNPFDYLLLKNQYALSYHRDRGSANWVSWHLDSSWIGSTPRQDDFRADPSLPAGWYHVNEFDYSGSGFDRGHHTPSGDRTRSVPDNSATFFMTNMMAQAPNNNQGPWEELESQSRTIAGQGNELYIVAGGVGTGGTGSNGFATTIANGNVTVPAYTWKVMIILPSGDNDVARVTTSTRTIAVIMPNTQGILNDPWQKYLATVDQVEALTGYDFFSNVPVAIQDVIESQVDAASNTQPQSISGGSFSDLSITAPITTLTGNVTVTGMLTLGGSYLTTGANRIILGPNATVNRISGKVIGSVEKQFGSSSLTTFEYPVGTNNGYSPLSLQLTALGIDPSSLTVRAVEGAHPNAPVPNAALRRYWDLTETGELSAILTFNYLDIDRPSTVPNEMSWKLRRYNGSTFDPVPATLNTIENTMTTESSISDFSDWTFFGLLTPTAAFTTVSGQVYSSNGRTISRARVTILDGQGNFRTTLTNAFGYYQVDGLLAGENYVGTVTAKGYTFQPKLINVGDSIFDADFVGEPIQP